MVFFFGGGAYLTLARKLTRTHTHTLSLSPLSLSNDPLDERSKVLTCATLNLEP